MGHGHRRRRRAEFDPEPAAEPAIVEALALVEESPLAAVLPEAVVVERDRYHFYPRFVDDSAAEDALLRERWNPDDARIQRILQPGDPDGPRHRFAGGSNSSGRRSKDTGVLKIDSAAALQALMAESPGDEDPGAVRARFRVFGLTPGEGGGKDGYFFNRRKEARDVLAVAAARIIAEPECGERSRQRRSPSRADFDVYGIATRYSVALRIYSGTARRELARHAHLHDHERIIALDHALLLALAEHEVAIIWRSAGRDREDDSLDAAWSNDVAVRLREIEERPLDKTPLAL